LEALPCRDLNLQFVIVGLALFIAGCSGITFTKEGITQQQFEADKFDCEQKVVTMYGGYAQMGVGHAIVARDDLRRCMFTKGYREATAQETKRSPQQSEVEYYEEMAVHGDHKAQLSLGWLYARGQGVEQDYAKARLWYEKSAAQGNAKAQYTYWVSCMATDRA
jgi:hypothetical protein